MTDNTDELAGLSAEVREAVNSIDHVLWGRMTAEAAMARAVRSGPSRDWRTVRAELLRLASENAELQSWLDVRERSCERWKRIAEAKRWAEWSRAKSADFHADPPEPARDAKDAARYRWLRERVEVKREGGFWWLAEMEGGFPCTEDFTGNLDTEIDAAMAQESGDE